MLRGTRHYNQEIKVENVAEGANNKCPDFSGLCPSSVECSLMCNATLTSNWFKIWKLRYASARANFKWTENQHWVRADGMSRDERWDASPVSSSVCYPRRVWSRGPARTAVVCPLESLPQSTPSLADATAGDAVNETRGQTSKGWLW